LTVGAMTALVLLAYPLWLQFFGRGTYHGTGFDQRIHSEDITAYAAFPQRSLAGLAGLVDRHLAPNPTEENSFFGWPLLLLVVVAAVLLLRRGRGERRPVIWALAGAGLVFAVFSFGPVVKFQRHITGFPLPYSWIAHLPLFDSALPARLALI